MESGHALVKSGLAEERLWVLIDQSENPCITSLDFTLQRTHRWDNNAARPSAKGEKRKSTISRKLFKTNATSQGVGQALVVDERIPVGFIELLQLEDAIVDAFN